MEKVLNYKQVMELTGLGKSHVYQLVSAGKLAGYRSGRRRLFFESGVRQYIDSQRNTTHAAPPPRLAAPAPRRRSGSPSTPATGLKFL